MGRGKMIKASSPCRAKTTEPSVWGNLSNHMTLCLGNLFAYLAWSARSNNPTAPLLGVVPGLKEVLPSLQILRSMMHY